MRWFSHLVANILILSFFMFTTTNADDNNAACNHETQLVILTCILFYFISKEGYVTICFYLLQVKVKNWVDGKEGDMLNAMTAKFGSILPKLADQSLKSPLISSIPADCCSPSTSKVHFSSSFSYSFFRNLLCIASFIIIILFKFK